MSADPTAPRASGLFDKPTRLFVLLGAFFVTNALLAEFTGVKIFSLERTLGREPVAWRLLGDAELSFNLTAGVLLVAGRVRDDGHHQRVLRQAWGAHCCRSWPSG